ASLNIEQIAACFRYCRPVYTIAVGHIRSRDIFQVYKQRVTARVNEETREAVYREGYCPVLTSPGCSYTGTDEAGIGRIVQTQRTCRSCQCVSMKLSDLYVGNSGGIQRTRRQQWEIEAVRGHIAVIS